MYKKILVPLDGSKVSASVLPQVIELAKAFSSQVILFHSCTASVDPAMGEAAGQVKDIAAAAEQKACETFLSDAARGLKEQGIDVNTVCVTGSPALEIIGYADENKVDLIVMASHGRGEVAWILGSVAERVVTHATVPLLLHRVLKPQRPMPRGEYVGMP